MTGERERPEERSQQRILLVEDDEELRAMLADRLRAAGLYVAEADDGDRVPEAWNNGEGPFDMLVSDVQMRRWSGLRALAWLRRAGDASPVLLVTSFGDRATHARAARLGATVLDKPFDLSEFEERVKALLPVDAPEGVA